MKVGGRLLLYAWAQEQDGASRRRFDGPDVLVQWHLRQTKRKISKIPLNQQNALAKRQKPSLIATATST